MGVRLLIKEGDTVKPGQPFALTSESGNDRAPLHGSAGARGVVSEVVPDGDYTVVEPLAYVTNARGEKTALTLSQLWPVRTIRDPFAERLTIDRPLVTGQRVLDTLFPVGKGGCAAIPAPSARARPSCSTSSQSGRTRT